MNKEFKRVLVHRFEQALKDETSFCQSAVSNVNEALSKAEEKGLVLTDESINLLMHNYGLYEDNLLTFITEEASTHKLKILRDATIEQLAVMFTYATEARENIAKAMRSSTWGIQYSLGNDLYIVKDCRLKLVEEFSDILEEKHSIYLTNQKQVDILNKAKQIELLTNELTKELATEGDYLRAIRGNDGYSSGLLNLENDGSLSLRTEDIRAISMKKLKK